MMTSVKLGWEPPERVRRPVAIPESLDRRLAAAAEGRSSPSAIVAEALADAVSRGEWGQHELRALSNGSGEQRVRRMIVIDAAVNERLDDWTAQSGEDFSDVATAIVKRFIDRASQQVPAV